MNFLKRLIRHELITGSFYIFIGSTITNFLAFLLNLFFARSLSYADYGVFASLVSVVTLASIPGSSINTILVRFATDYYSKGQLDHLKNFYKKAFKYILAFSLLILTAFVLLSPFMQAFLHLDNSWYVVFVGICVFMGYIQILNAGFLQGLLKFGFLSFVNTVGALVKLIVGITLVFLGFRVFSGLGALFFMALSSFILGFLPLRFIFSKKTESDVHIPTRQILNYALPVFIVILFMTSFTSTDIILVKHFFNPHQAGFYAGLSLIGRVIFYFTIPIPGVMFPLLIRRHNLGKNFNNLFYLALGLVLIPSLAITGFYFLFPKFVVSLFLGGRDYLAIVPYVGFFGINLTIFSLINVCINFFLSLNKTGIAPLVVVAAIAQILLIYIFHANFYQVITVSISVSSVLLLALMGYYLKLFVRPLKS